MEATRSAALLVRVTRTTPMPSDVTCVGFPDRSLDYPTRTLRPNVLLSISMYEPVEYMNTLLQNALNFTESSTMLNEPSLRGGRTSSP